ncbi:LOW QUALITY PROTEIN: sialic acid-binding Ig-like lectin 10 [Pseudorasbora parva]|uniref:LOW QUALITY PROTEIN: sialic acid-binding Ig-like lectin 10 n=1 Tax=Pseudorasbora parva TaxID=51549 RepID=UPI00351E70A7
MLQTLLFILTAVKMINSIGVWIFLPGEPTDFFSITVRDSYTGEAGLCISVFCLFTIPLSVSEPIKITWFKEDALNRTVEVPVMTSTVDKAGEGECSFILKNLVQGESEGEYRLKLEWGQGKVYIFPQKVQITVKELTQKPTIDVPQLTVGEKAEISCKVPGDCMNPLGKIVWKGIEPDEIRRHGSAAPGSEKHFSIMIFHPELEHHNTKLTCTVIFQESIQTESTVIPKVRHAPKILNSSRCLEWGNALTCMCVSSGMPLPQIYWTNLDGEYYSAFSAENTISIITVSIASSRNLNSTIECVSKNPIGWTKMDIQVHNRAEKPKVSWSLSTPWIFFNLSVVVNVIFASCLTVILGRKTQKQPNDDNHVYMSTLKREESVYENINVSSERS